ncbi:LLM class flavin-dependent oxidoreductase [Cumulibacter manganitolerans]|uniref:LLM class flavin-dependent oxidoreductase n=1 Tax=Cumulibacter manganitolerans TaxID=1884992 RepID=UPI001295C6FF|nr:LLM class flavin-dependent oxidoreductase [Cumulibacter manganitolerans]
MSSHLGLVLKSVAAADVATIAAAAEDAGFSHLYLPETGLLPGPGTTGRDPFITSSAALQATSALQVGPGVAVTLVRPGRLAGLLAATINEQSGGRFIMGIGVSHRPAIEALGLPYPSSPLGHLRSYLDDLDAAESDIAFGAGYPVMVGALGPKMIDLAAAEADGAVLNWLTLAKARTTVARLTETARASGKDGVASALFVRVGPPGDVRADAASYNDRLPNYRKHFLSQGLTDADAVVAKTCMRLDAAEVVDTLAGYRDAGVTVPCVYPTGMTATEIVHLLDAVGRKAND